MSGTEQAVKKRSEHRQKGRVVPFRVSPAEYAELEQLADRSGLTLGSYIRSRCLEKPTTRARRKPAIEQVTVSHLIGELGRVKNNLNQLAKKANSGNFITQEILAALAVIQEIGQTAKQSMRNV